MQTLNRAENPNHPHYFIHLIDGMDLEGDNFFRNDQYSKDKRMNRSFYIILGL